MGEAYQYRREGDESMIFLNVKPPAPSPEQVAELESIIDAACENADGVCSEPGGDLVEMHHTGPE